MVKCKKVKCVCRGKKNLTALTGTRAVRVFLEEKNNWLPRNCKVSTSISPVREFALKTSLLTNARLRFSFSFHLQHRYQPLSLVIIH